ncbi:acyl-coenzyme A thioesterase 13-like [Drosophila madeirensis]|uniref:Blast:Acyl-coenzyme A thioesterase 13 n=2 Tax=obscura subgroup TaxID=32357 RepID=A0A3B0KMT2_DROGU|nr:acyl-coenzyme A thioesterase 13-like [Drosophila guanche]XP_034657235.1 acyl-coenzyme A thioesterase 13-like [Drosophila subobscura]SPP87146.1 blast:Acyl-coenzyme A thioesterase 13 [Drosophila guanche]
MSGKRGVDFVKQVAEYAASKGGFDRVLKMITITGGGEGRAIGEFTVEKEHLNRQGTLHGGLTATIVDNVTTYALMSAGSHPGVTATLNVSYMSAAKPGEVVEIDARTLRAGRKMAYLDCVLRRKSDGRIIASGGQVKYVDFEKET